MYNSIKKAHIYGTPYKHEFSSNESLRLSVFFPDLFDLHGRLFNHRPFLQGEIRRHEREFESRRGDREVEAVFRSLEVVTELRDGEVDRLAKQCSATLPAASEAAEAADRAAAAILERGGAADVEQAAEASRQAREKEWAAFVVDAQDRYTRIRMSVQPLLVRV